MATASLDSPLERPINGHAKSLVNGNESNRLYKISPDVGNGENPFKNKLDANLDNCEEDDDEDNDVQEEVESEDVYPMHTINKLPPGWRIMSDEQGQYYWHVGSGVTQRELPRMSKDDLDIHSSHQNKSIGLPMSQSEYCFSNHSSAFMPDKQSSTSLASHNPADVIFAVYALGSLVLNENELTNVSDCTTVIASAIQKLARSSEELDESKSARLLIVFENEHLKLLDSATRSILLSHPVWTIRAWGVGKEGRSKEFAFVARDRETRQNQCHVFRCDTAARHVASALQSICQSAVQQRTQKRRSLPANPFLLRSLESDSFDSEMGTEQTTYGMELLNLEAPNEPFQIPPSSPRTPLDTEPLDSAVTSRHQVWYVGSIPTDQPSGVHVINEAIDDLSDIQQDEFVFVSVDVSPSTIVVRRLSPENMSQPDSAFKRSGSITGHVITESRVRYISFLGIGAKDPRYAAYVVCTCRNQFICHVFYCEPHGGNLAKALEAACRIRYQKCLEAKRRELMVPRTTPQPQRQNSIAESYTGYVKGGVYSLWNKVKQNWKIR